MHQEQQALTVLQAVAHRAQLLRIRTRVPGAYDLPEPSISRAPLTLRSLVGCNIGIVREFAGEEVHAAGAAK